MRGGFDGALQGASTLITPVLLFIGLLGPLAGAPGLWGSLLAITLVPVLRLLLGGASCIVLAPRTASTATYLAMVLHLGLAASGVQGAGNKAVLDLGQLQLGLAAASLMYVLASALVAFSGFIKLGRVFKMIPTPVTTGISNGTAMLLLTLAIGRVAGGGWLAGLNALTMVLSFYAWTWLQRHRPWARAVPPILLAILVGLLGALLLSDAHDVQGGAARSDLFSAGRQWASVLLWSSLHVSQLREVLMLGIPGAITLALVLVLETFTASSAMEIRFGVRSHADRELIALGGANMLGAVLGASPCSGSPVYSVACWQAGGRGLAAALFCCAFSGAAMAVFNPWFMVLPAGLAAGLLVLQAALMGNPAFTQNLREIIGSKRWYRPRTQDLGFWIAVVISLVGFFGNLIWACFAGVGLSCLAVLRRVSVNLTAQWLYLDSLRSRRIRTKAESEALTHLAQDVGILRLTGHLFFGNSARITQLIDELHEDAACVVIDVSQVQDADPSGLDALAWLVRALKERHMVVVITGLAKTRVLALKNMLGQLNQVEQCVDLDRGLELCEEWILKNATVLPGALASLPIERNSLLQGLQEDEVTAVLMLADVREVAQGEVLFRKDQASDGVWMLRSGQISILAGSGPMAPRLATFGPGQFVGEMSLIDGNVRSATASADSAVSAVLLDNQAIAALVRDHPNAALQITRNIARELSQRVRSTSAVLAQESDAPSSMWGVSVLGAAGK
jgi:MFS superfamily sulfate permease-like transporter